MAVTVLQLALLVDSVLLGPRTYLELLQHFGLVAASDANKHMCTKNAKGPTSMSIDKSY